MAALDPQEPTAREFVVEWKANEFLKLRYALETMKCYTKQIPGADTELSFSPGWPGGITSPPTHHQDSLLVTNKQYNKV